MYFPETQQIKTIIQSGNAKHSEQPLGHLSMTLYCGSGHQLGKLPQRSKDKASWLGFSQWTGIFSSALVAARPRRL